MISERTLRRWRRDALRGKGMLDSSVANNDEMCERVLRLTQELMDLHLMRKE